MDDFYFPDDEDYSPFEEGEGFFDPPEFDEGGGFDDLEFASVSFDDLTDPEFEDFDFSPFDEFDVFTDPFADDEEPQDPEFTDGVDFFADDIRGPFPDRATAVAYGTALPFEFWQVIRDAFNDTYYLELLVSG